MSNKFKQLKCLAGASVDKHAFAHLNFEVIMSPFWVSILFLSILNVFTDEETEKDHQLIPTGLMKHYMAYAQIYIHPKLTEETMINS